MIIVTCAGGKTGKAIVKQLVKIGREVRAIVGHQNSIAKIHDLGAAEVFCCDLNDANAVENAFIGGKQLYYIAPNMNPAERIFGKNIIAAARVAGLEKIVFHSMLHTQLEELPHHWERHFVEADLMESGLCYTILQCGSYMQNMLPNWNRMIETGVHSMPYAISCPMSLVDLNDICEVAAKVLSSTKYNFGTYEICGDAITLSEKASILSNVLGKEIRAEKSSLEQALEHGRMLNFSDYSIETMKKMFPYYDKHGLVGSPCVLEWILGRSHSSFQSFAERMAAG